LSQWREDFLRDFAAHMDRCEKEVGVQEEIERSQVTSSNRLDASP